MACYIYAKDDYNDQKLHASSGLLSSIQQRTTGTGNKDKDKYNFRTILEKIHAVFNNDWYGPDPTKIVSKCVNNGLNIDYSNIPIMSISELEQRYNLFTHACVQVRGKIVTFNKPSAIKVSAGFVCGDCCADMTACFPYGVAYSGEVKCKACKKTNYLQSCALVEDCEYAMCWRAIIEELDQTTHEMHTLNALIPLSIRDQLLRFAINNQLNITGIIIGDAPATRSIVNKRGPQTKQFLSVPIVLYVLSVAGPHQQRWDGQTFAYAPPISHLPTSVLRWTPEQNNGLAVEMLRHMVHDFSDYHNLRGRCVERLLLLLAVASTVQCMQNFPGRSALFDDEETQLAVGITRRSLHIMFIGPAGEGKTTILRALYALYPGIVMIDAPTSTVRGIISTAKAAKKRAVGSKSELEAAHNTLICVDELDKNPEIIGALEDAMNYGETSITKAGIHVAYKCRTSVVAACNPFGKNKTYNSMATVAMNLGAYADQMLDLFDIVWPVLPDRSNISFVTPASYSASTSTSTASASMSNGVDACCHQVTDFPAGQALHKQLEFRNLPDGYGTSPDTRRLQQHLQEVIARKWPTIKTDIMKNVLDLNNTLCEQYKEVIRCKYSALAMLLRISAAIARLLLADNLTEEHLKFAGLVCEVVYGRYAHGSNERHRTATGRMARLRQLNEYICANASDPQQMTFQWLKECAAKFGFLQYDAADVIGLLNSTATILRNNNGTYRLNI